MLTRCKNRFDRSPVVYERPALYTWFLPRDATLERGYVTVCLQSVRPSVRLSFRERDTSKIISRLNSVTT